jgi:hypothetical protein
MAGFSSGSVLFAGPGGSISQNNANFFWDNANGRLGIGTNAPAYTLSVSNSSTSFGVNIKNTNSAGRAGFYLQNNASAYSGLGTYGSTFGSGQTNNTLFFSSHDFQIAAGESTGTGVIKFSTGTNVVNTIGMQLFQTNNLVLQNGGTFTDSGERLQVSGSAKITNGLSVTGSITANSITVTGTLTAQTIVAQTITSSILYSSGSNIFGNSLSNTQDFTGSVRITGSLQLTGDATLRSSGTTSATSALQILNSIGGSLFSIRNDGLGNLYGNLQIASLYPYLQLIPTSWGSFYIQSGVNLAADGAGNYTFFLNPASKGFAFGQGSNISMVFAPTTNNVTIGATTDTGERLQVSGSSRFAGDMVITGSGATSGTNALTIQNSSNLASLTVRNDRTIILNGGTAQYTDSNLVTTRTSTDGISFLFQIGSGGNVGGLILSHTGAHSKTSGESKALNITHNFTPTSGTATFTGYQYSATINQTGGANGITRGIYVNPIITAAADFRAIEWSNNAATAPSASWGLYGAGTAPNFLSGSLLIGSTTNTGERLQVTGTARISQALTASSALISGSGTQRLTVVGSGSAQPLFTVQGSQGELFSIVDSLSGSLFSVNDQSGLPIMEVFSDNTILMGNYLDPMLLTTTRTGSAVGINTLYTLPTSSYDAVYIDYTIRSGSNARAGNFMAMWSGTSVNFTDNSITEFGTTSGFVFGAHVSGSNMVVTGSSSTSGWTVKTIVKAI